MRIARTNNQFLSKFVPQALRSARGQALVVLLLILVVTMTIGLSVVTRTLINVKEASTTERSTRAFSAAEAGVETALRQDIPSLLQGGVQATTLPQVSLGNGSARSDITISKSGGTTDGYQPIKPVLRDDVIQLNVDGTGLANATQEIKIFWSLKNTQENPTCSSSPVISPAALEVTFVSWPGGASTSYPVTRDAYNSYTCPITGSGFTGSQSSSNTAFVSMAQVLLPANSRVLRLRPLYSDATIRVEPVDGRVLPVQSYTVRSEGVAGDTKRVVQVERSIGGLPAIFDYVVYNGSDDCPLDKSGDCD